MLAGTAYVQCVDGFMFIGVCTFASSNIGHVFVYVHCPQIRVNYLAGSFLGLFVCILTRDVGYLRVVVWIVGYLRFVVWIATGCV
jgi:hypothetical protein